MLAWQTTSADGSLAALSTTTSTLRRPTRRHVIDWPTTFEDDSYGFLFLILPMVLRDHKLTIQDKDEDKDKDKDIKTHCIYTIY